MLRAAVVIVLLCVPASALAQNSTTTCRPAGNGQVVCDTREQPTLQSAPPINYSAMLNPVQPVDAGLNAYLAAKAQSRQRLIDQVSPLMAAGQCETARMMAVQQRDNELADLIYRTCQPR